MKKNGFLTQGDLAAHTGIALSTVNNFLKGRAVSIDKIYVLSEALGLSQDDHSLFEATHSVFTEALLKGLVDNDPDAPYVVTRVSGVSRAAQDISKTPVDDVQGNASNQITILASYYSEGLTQAKTSFRSALIISGIGFFFFLTSVIFVLNRQPRDRTLIPLVSGAIIEVVAGINFYLYGQATKQLAIFQNKLDQMQRFLLANSICESLEGDSKQAARTKLVETVSSLIE